MKPKILLILCSLELLVSCNNSTQIAEKQTEWKAEIIDTEKRFADMAREVGIKEAFVHFADTNAVLLRKNELIQSKNSITEYLSNRSYPEGSVLSWAPDFVEVSQSGDLGYTYGHYKFEFVDSTGNQQVSSGIFHTVWKRQPDGTWRYVWD